MVMQRRALSHNLQPIFVRHSQKISPKSGQRCSGQTDRQKSAKSYAFNLNHVHEELHGLVGRMTIRLELINISNELDR